METNPYQSPVQSPFGGAAPAKPTRPTSVAVFGYLNLVFGAMGVCGALMGMLSFAMLSRMPQNPNVRNPVMELMANNPGYRLYNQVSIGLGLVATIVLITAGIGLLQMKPFGRLLSIGYSMYAIMAGIANLVISYMFIVQPLMERANAAGGGPEQAGAIGGMIGGLFGGCFGMAYPIILLIFMYRRNVVEALQG